MITREHVTPGLLRDATDLVVRTQFGSQRMLKIALHIDYATAANLIEELTDRGILGRSLANGLVGDECLLAREVLYPPSEHDDALALADHQHSGSPR